mgnify:CR=1 FL=1
MGGRGAKSGISARGHKHGTQYDTLLQEGVIKFVKKATRQSESLMETTAPGRIYVTIGGNEARGITFFDDGNKGNKVIEQDKRTGEWHVHNGYLHTEYSEEHRDRLSDSDGKLLDMVKQAWNNRH